MLVLALDKRSTNSAKATIRGPNLGYGPIWFSLDQIVFIEYHITDRIGE